MRQRHLDRLFERFRRRGDARALAKVFDATAPELYHVATHLSKNLHTAEDLVQSTFLSAIETRETWDESRGVLPWLIGILAHRAAYERRRESRTIEPERLVNREVSQPAEALESQELSDGLARAIDKLPALYRDVLVAHLRHGKTPQEIARDLGRAPGTVRVELHRGLEMLRKVLPASLATGGALAALSPRGLSAVRGSVMHSAIKVSASIAATSVASPAVLLVGGFAMSSKMLLAVAGVTVGLACAGGWALQRPRAQHDEVDAAPTLAQQPLVALDTASEHAHPEQSLASEIETPASELTDPTSTRAIVASAPDVAGVSGRLLAPDGSPASGAFVALVRMAGGSPRDSVREGTTSSAGTFQLSDGAGAYIVVGMAKGFLPIVQDVTLDGRSAVDLAPAKFSAGAHIRGRVLILGAPAPAGCSVSASAPPRPSVLMTDRDLTISGAVFHTHGGGAIDEVIAPRNISIHGETLLWSSGRLLAMSRSTVTDDQGRFALEALEPQLYSVSVANAVEKSMLHATKDITAPADNVELDIDCARIVVRAMSDGQPFSVHFALTENTTGSVWGFGGKSRIEVWVAPNAEYRVHVEKEGYKSVIFDLTSPASGESVEREVDVAKIADGAELIIQLVTPDGRGIPSAGFGLFGTKHTQGARAQMGRPGTDGTMPDVVRDERGAGNVFHLRDLAPDHYKLMVVADGNWKDGSSYWSHDPIEVDLDSNATTQRKIELHFGGRLRVKCSNERGKSLAPHCKLFDSKGLEVPFTFFTQDERKSTWLGGHDLNASAPGGANEMFPNLAPGQYELRLSLDGYRSSSQVITVEAGTTHDVWITLKDG